MSDLDGAGEIRSWQVVIRRDENLFFVIEEEMFTVNLWDFEVNGSELLPEHVATLDEALEMLEDETISRPCETKLTPRADPVVRGYASQTGPEANNRRFADRRADAVAAYVNEWRAARKEEKGESRLFKGSIKSDAKLPLEMRRMREDPYYCYTYKLNSAATETAERLQGEVCGDRLASDVPGIQRLWRGGMNLIGGETEAFDRLRSPGICRELHPHD